jgi:hypothetical protein
MSIYCLLSVAVFGCFVLISAGDVDHLEHLHTELFKEYKRHVAPKNVTVLFGINYLCGDLDERTHILNSRVFERYKWTDPRLNWDPSKYGGIEEIHVSARRVWVPDNLRVVNSLEGFGERDEVSLSLDHDGHLYWIPLAEYKTYCSRSPSYRQDHSHNCYIGFGPWSQGIPILKTQLLFQEGVEIDDTIFNEQCPYEIGEHQAEFTTETYPCCPGPFKLLSFHFDIHKRGFGKKKDEDKKEQSRNCVWPHCP